MVRGDKMKLIKWGNKKKNQDISHLESLLDRTLQPENPREEFVNRLRYQNSQPIPADP